jgi:hypothetical protein
MRGLVPAEIAIVIVIAMLPLPEPIPLAIPLVIAASIAKWVRGASWSDVGSANGFHALVGLGAGIVGLTLALVAGTPLVETMTSRAVEWSSNAIVRGNMAMLGSVVIFAAMVSACMEAALRGWIVERVLELAPRRSGTIAPSHVALAVLAGAFAEAIVTPGDLAVRIGAAVWGIGFGWLYVAAKRNVLVPMLARMTFSVVLVILEGIRIV